MALDELLRKHGFVEHPFATWIAEDERFLPEWFVAPPFFSTLMGATGRASSPYSATSNVIFGGPGSGKTALRSMMEREILKSVPDALVIRYIDFSGPLLAGPRPTVADHVEEILRVGTMSLLNFWYENQEKYAALAVSEKAELAGLSTHYFEKLSPETKELYSSKLSPIGSRMALVAKQGTRAVVEAYNTAISVLKREKIVPTEWSSDESIRANPAMPALRLRRFWSLARSLGVSSIWVLVDGVDEATGVANPDAIFNCVADLLLAQSILEFRQDDVQVLCFKVFLTRPDDVAPRLDAAGFRRDRVKTETIAWTRKDLDTVLKRRLAHFSTNQVLHLDEICVPDAAGTHDRVLDESKLRPRLMFRIAHEILSCFQRNSGPGDYLLDRTSIEAGIKAAHASFL